MATDDADKLDPKVKDFIDAATRAELERWFGLPSFEVTAEKAKPPKPEDPEVVKVREQRAKAMAAVDPALLEALRVKFEDKSESLIRFQAQLSLRVDPEIALFDHAMVERQASIAEPREVEISEELRDDLKDCTPQAILRDLHRPEIDFDKTFEIVDMSAEQRLDIVAEVKAAMSTNWKLPPLDELPFKEACTLVAEVVALRRTPWPKLILSQKLPNRRVTE
jgi:hypothetical protein